MSKLTPWFNAKTNPFRIGVYEVRSEVKGHNFSYFDGMEFNGCWLTPETALCESNFGQGLEPTKWRGIAEKP